MYQESATLCREVFVLRNYWPIVLITFVISLAASAVFAQRQPKTFMARATLVVGPNARLATSREIVDSLNALDRRSVVATLARVPSSRIVTQRAEQTLHLPDNRRAFYQVKTVVVPDTNILEISVSGPDPRFVARLANEIAVQTVTYSRDFYLVYDLKPLDQAPQMGEPTGPGVTRQVAAGGMLGLLAGLLAAYLLCRMRRAGTMEGLAADTDLEARVYS